MSFSKGFPIPKVDAVTVSFDPLDEILGVIEGLLEIVGDEGVEVQGVSSLLPTVRLVRNSRVRDGDLDDFEIEVSETENKVDDKPWNEGLERRERKFE